MVIGGSDSSGGAGIQADIRALQYAGAPAACAITAVTAQGVDGVTAIQFTDPLVLRAQIDQAFKTYDIKAVKIGMLGSAVQVREVIEALRNHKIESVVLDPVLESSSGHSLLDDAGRNLMIKELLPLCRVITPNVPELAVLSGMPVETETDRINAATKLIRVDHAKAVIVKGGHLNEPTDILVDVGGETSKWGNGFRKMQESRGTGCVLASFLTANLVEHSSLASSMEKAKRNLNLVLRDCYARAENESALLLVRDRVRVDILGSLEMSGIYYVTDGRLNPKFSLSSGARLAQEGGAKIVQLRDKTLPLNDLISVGKRMASHANKNKTMMIVNDRVDVAMAVGADGVHLGPDDMHPETARDLLGWDKVVGASVATVEEAKPISRWVDYLAVGAIFGSSTKGDAGDPVGVERITEIKNAFPDKKIVAIGGINMSNIASVGAAGADASAVISAIVCAEDPAQATRDLLAEFNRGKQQR